MNSLNKPTDKAEDVYCECISNLKDDSLKEKLINIKDIIKNDSLEYEKLIKDGLLFKLKEKKQIGELTKDNLVKIYDQKMVRKGQPGRKFYDKLLSVPQYGICPYCGVQIVSTLDHFLPKTKFISLVVTPSNLIPVCFECNKNKTDKKFSSKEDIFINPYFDDLGNDIWLKASINHNEFTMTYSVIKPNKWDDVLFKRVSNHFEILQLNKLYSIHAAQRLVNVKKRMINIYLKRGEKEMMLDLNENLNTYEDDKNNWEAAMYRELIEDDWVRKKWIKKQVIETILD